ncbi:MULTISPECIES: hypothetical protein [Marinobacter]|jgi:hypothetical protein|uniref:Uncharacterized protein n=3 Tax=Marinobacter TaxID=2742 RepID=A0A455W8B8_MARNT|nr:MULTISPECIES: hypothetical protein [Marinobacter]MDX5442035.1 hypothetical protein [Alteromonadaceae bacterium]WBU41493.1 hypothetical protein PBN92_00895 [Marinobacter alkaliphilus]BBJ02443.1 hypothetical protein YBY_02910 [Marinobacter nauticus]AMQ88977.1 hypothetical protein ASQ50_09900 [Marinobacter sp. LQ44]KXO10726.1 hypothetical protein J122_1342 [Marinobacter excellens LAMA 842]|eukprot:TRINITY_DN9219_c0_g1_i1.p1 TRINITY_DN9219_c0_g1~~TRINITY_DN9219_c0_g1_i1.p1  ORF type:complete len:203 (-),score=4.02 TRINITY_DN9219_c0_g1_i1:135-743(-)
MNQSMAIDDLVSVAQAEAMGELDAPMMAIVLSSEQSYDLPINSLETDADKARWGLILRAAREHVEADAVAVLYPAWTTIRRKPTDAETSQAQAEDEDSADDDNGPIDTLFVQLHTRDRIYWRGFEQIRDPKHQRIIGFRRIKALSTDYDRDSAPSVAAWLSTLFEPLPDEGEETDIDRELADLLEEPEVSAALYPRQMRALH